MSRCPNRCTGADPCERCERLAEDMADERAEERVRGWTERGEAWAEAVVYGTNRGDY